MYNRNEFDSEFCNVKFILKDNVVLLAWKKFSSYDNYRKPTLFALEMLKQYPKGCEGIVSSYVKKQQRIQVLSPK